MSQADHSVLVTVEAIGKGPVLLAPCGLTTPHARSLGCTVTGGEPREIAETNAGQTALAIRPTADRVVLRYSVAAGGAPYPDAVYGLRDTRFTRASDDLIGEAVAIAPGRPPLERARMIACEVAQKFTYDHPETPFYDGFDVIPFLGCGATPGSCIDINTYLIASFRAAGISLPKPRSFSLAE